jgi:hypothetical protein
MERLTVYRQIINDIINRHASIKPSHGQVTPLAICDPTNDNYVLMDIGWDAQGRVHSIAFHCRIYDGKIWIEWDGTSPGIAQELLDAGISRQDIVLAFYPPSEQQFLEMAVA